MSDDEVKPVVDMTFMEALDMLTGFEILGIQAHYKLDLEKLGGIRSIIGTVWAYERRENPQLTWGHIEHRSLKSMKTYFAPDDPGVDSDQSKELPNDEGTPVD